MYKVQVGKKILSANEQFAAKNKQLFTQQGKLCLNMISSPGSGKTTILARTIKDLAGKLRIGVIEGDIQTDIDAQKIRQAGAKAIQINTQGACHLSAEQVHSAVGRLGIEKLDLIFIENVGNLVCPAAFELGESDKIVVLSVAEGDDKAAKYPAIFAKSKVLLINKTDLLETTAVDFSIERVKADVHKLNGEIEIFLVSARTGEGMDKWYDWLIKATKETQSR